MSGDLTNQTPKDSYKDLIQIKNSNQGVNTSFNPVTDGLGNQTALSLSTSGVSIESGLLVKNVEINYEMNNVLNIIYDSLGKRYNDNQIIFNQYYPSASRMASLSIKWSFLN